jgi:hypothetical protein
MKDPDIKVMTRADLEDEVMLLRAQVKVLQNWRALHEAMQDTVLQVEYKEYPDPERNED